MKTQASLLCFLIAGVALGAPTTYNVSSQGADNCEAAVRSTISAVFGAGQKYSLRKSRLQRGACDGQTCNPDSQNFIVRFKNEPNFVYNFHASGPDSASRCYLQLTRARY